MILHNSPKKFNFIQNLKKISFFETLILIASISFLFLFIYFANYTKRLFANTNSLIVYSAYSGNYTKPFNIHLLPLSLGGEIKYTTNGANPTITSTKYSGPIKISKNTVLKAQIYKDNKPFGKVNTQTYFINEKSTLPIISVITDPQNLWDEEIGIYVAGNKNIDTNEIFVPNYLLRGKEWRRDAFIEYFDNSGDFKFNSKGSIKIHGSTTSKYPQKSLRYCATSNNNLIQYPIFNDNLVNKYNCLLFRISGNDWRDTMFRDAIAQTIISKTTKLDIQKYQPTILFLNGEYWGIHNIREYYNAEYFANKYKVSSKDIVILFPDRFKNGYPKVEAGSKGDELHYVNMFNFIKKNNMAIDSNYKYIETLMDINNYADYMITQIYYNNTDWGDSNLKVWRYKNSTRDSKDNTVPYGLDGKWRWLLYDLDEAMNLPQGTRNTLANSIDKNINKPHWTKLIFTKLLANEQFKKKFIKRYIYHLNYTFTEKNIIDTINDFEKNIEPEIPRHAEKWGGLVVKRSNSWISFRDLNEWKKKVNVMREYVIDRRKYAIQHLVDQFNLQGTANVTINNSNGITILENYRNAGNWEGNYIIGIPYEFKVEPKLGYNFSKIDCVNCVIYNNKITFTATNATINILYNKNYLGKIINVFNK